MIRKSTVADLDAIISAVSAKNIAYITAEHINNDIKNSCQFVMVEDDSLVAIVSLVYDADFNYYAIKRLCALNNNYHGVAYQMINYIINQLHGVKVGCTPWDDNYPMQHILRKLGFTLEYKFEEKWCFYSKNA